MNVADIKGIIFDYGGTIDSNGDHWSEVLWSAYQEQKIPVAKEHFREAYVFAERYLATHKIIMEDDNYLSLLNKKVKLQFKYLEDKGFLAKSEKTKDYWLAISNQCYTFVFGLISAEKFVLEKLHSKYPMVLVSNFYGNIETVLDDFGISACFDHIIESAVVGIRKPDPAIFSLGVKTLNLRSENIVVIGDSYTKDIIPASSIGCKTIWLKGLGWEDDDQDATADIVIHDFMELKSIFEI